MAPKRQNDPTAIELPPIWKDDSELKLTNRSDELDGDSLIARSEENDAVESAAAAEFIDYMTDRYASKA